MKIIILGAGQVGGTLAENLVTDNNEITLIDTDGDRLRELQDKFDLRAVVGNASHPSSLRNAGADDADMLVAVTNTDETNMAACQVAFSLFNTPNRIARIRSSEYLIEKDSLFNQENIPINNLITPEKLVITQIVKTLEYPGALQVTDFADGKVKLVSVKAYYGGPLVGNPISEIKEHMPLIDARIVAIYRQGISIRPQGSTIIEADDEILFIADSKNIRSVISELQRLEKSYQRIMIVGGGNIGAGLAAQIENVYNVKLIEKDYKRTEDLSESLQTAIVFCGDASDQTLLSQEHIEEIDVFIALTNSDEANIMSSLLAKKMGAKKVMTLIQRNAYTDLIQGGEIDIVVSPQQATISSLLTHVRRGDIVKVLSLKLGSAEVIEVIAHGDKNTSNIVDQKIANLDLPIGVIIGAIVRGNEVIIAHSHVEIKQGDHVIMYINDKKLIAEIEKLFQPSPFFL